MIPAFTLFTFREELGVVVPTMWAVSPGGASVIYEPPRTYRISVIWSYLLIYLFLSFFHNIVIQT